MIYESSQTKVNSHPANLHLPKSLESVYIEAGLSARSGIVGQSHRGLGPFTHWTESWIYAAFELRTKPSLRNGVKMNKSLVCCVLRACVIFCLRLSMVY